jgi:streptomycin 6-kinase
MSPDHIALRAQNWKVAIHHTRETTASVIAFGERHNTPVVLKVTKQQGDEWHAGDVLRAFDGNGTVRVYESEAGAVLLERLDPGNELVELVRQGNDEKATEILAQVMQQMAHHAPPAHSPTVFDWARGFDRYLKSSDKQIDATLVSEVANLYRSLAASQQGTMLLHGDLQHYNVLFDSRRGWIAIDPKGVVGELEYEVGAILRNPVERPDSFATQAHHRKTSSRVNEHTAFGRTPRARMVLRPGCTFRHLGRRGWLPRRPKQPRSQTCIHAKTDG